MSQLIWQKFPSSSLHICSFSNKAKTTSTYQKIFWREFNLFLAFPFLFLFFSLFWMQHSKMRIKSGRRKNLSRRSQNNFVILLHYFISGGTVSETVAAWLWESHWLLIFTVEWPRWRVNANNFDRTHRVYQAGNQSSVEGIVKVKAERPRGV